MSTEDAGRAKQAPAAAEDRQPSLTPRAAAEKAERTERLAREMRKNLAKRKERQRQMGKAGGDRRPPGADG